MIIKKRKAEIQNQPLLDKFFSTFSCSQSSQDCVMKWPVAFNFLENMINEHENHLELIQLNTEKKLFMMWLPLFLNSLE